MARGKCSLEIAPNRWLFAMANRDHRKAPPELHEFDPFHAVDDSRSIHEKMLDHMPEGPDKLKAAVGIASVSGSD